MLLRIPPPFRLLRPRKQSPMTLVSAGVGIGRIFMGRERAWPGRTVKDRKGQGCAGPVQLAQDPALPSKCQPGKPRSNMSPNLRVWGPRTHDSLDHLSLSGSNLQLKDALRLKVRGRPREIKHIMGLEPSTEELFLLVCGASLCFTTAVGKWDAAGPGPFPPSDPC